MMTTFVDNLEFLVANYPQTKIFIHTDKPYYAMGEDMWFSVYGVNANDHAEDPVSGLVYVHLEAPNGEVIVERNIQLSGKYGNGDIEIGNDWEEGIYTLRGFSSYMLNYEEAHTFSKEIAIWSNVEEDQNNEDKTQKFEGTQVRFFPEGGHLVNGLECKVAFELSNGDEGEIMVKNEAGEVMTTAKSVHDGLGYFSIIPEFGKEYKAEYKGLEFDLPTVRQRGYGLKVNNLGKESLYIDITRTADVDLEGCFIIGHLRGLVFLQQDGINNENTRLKIDKASLPDGVAQLTLFSRNGSPVAERAVFINHDKNAVNAEIEVPYQYFNPRQKADLNINVKTAGGEAVNGDLSISIVDANLVSNLEKGCNIKSYFLLNSEFTRGLKDPNFYFKDNSNKTRFLLDLLMMTRGWTRIAWEDVVGGQEPDISYLPEIGFTVSGALFYRGNPTQGLVEVSIIDAGFMGDVVQTQPDGTFTITLPELREGSNIFLKASVPNPADPTLKPSSDHVRIIINGSGNKRVRSMNKLPFNYLREKEAENLVERNKKVQTVDSIYSATWAIELEEVSISATDLSRDKELRKEYAIGYRHYDNRIMMDSIMKNRYVRNIFELVRDQVPGVQIVGTPDVDQRFRMRGGSNTFVGSLDAKVLLDGNEVSYATLNALPVSQIAFIDVLRGLSSTTIFGGANGVIAVYTKRAGYATADDIYNQPDYVANIKYEGYSSNREFYSPNYSVPFPGMEKPDLRTTLYWNPRVNIVDGQGKVEFHTSDIASKYLIEVQGLTTSGIPFVGYGATEIRQ